MRYRPHLLIWIFLVAVYAPASALASDLASKLDDMIGYTIVEAKSISGYVDKDGEVDDGFEGCEFGRQIVFTDGTSVICDSFGYSFAFMPTAVLLGKKVGQFVVWKMVVDDDIYDVH